MFLRDIYERNLSWKNADQEQIQIANELKDMDKGKVPVGKRASLKNRRLLHATEKTINNSKNKIISKKHLEPGKKMLHLMK